MRIQGHRPTSLHLKARLATTQADHDLIRFGRYLDRHDHRMVLATGGGDGVRLAEAWKLEHETVSLTGTGFLASWRSRGKLAELIERRQPAIVETHDLASLKAVLTAKPRESALIAHVELSPEWLAVLEPKLIEACRHLVVTSHFEADELIERGIAKAAKIRVVRPTVDLREFDAKGVRGSRMSALAERWRLDVERKVLLMPAPVRSGHGHAALIDALGRLERRDFHLVMLGDHEAGDSFANQLEARAARWGLGECLRFMNDCDDMPAAYALAELVVLLPEEPHPLPRAALEAQAMGKPVILSGVGAGHELTMPASSGWLVAKDDPDELDWALKLALDLTAEVRERVAERARGFVESEFGVDQAGEKLLAIYAELKPPKPGR